MSSLPPETPPPPPPPGDIPPPPPGGPSEPPFRGAMPPNRKLMLILAYCGILSVIPLFAERDDREVHWHAKNGLGIFIAACLGAVVLTIVGSIVFGDDGCLSGCAFHCIYSLAFIALSIAAMAKALMRGRLRIPFISDLADRF